MTLLDRIIYAYNICKTRREKRQKIVKQLKKYALTIDQFENIQHAFIHYGLNKCCDVEPTTSDDESTFNNLEYVSKLGVQPGNENMWPVMMSAIKRKNQTIFCQS